MTRDQRTPVDARRHRPDLLPFVDVGATVAGTDHGGWSFVVAEVVAVATDTVTVRIAGSPLAVVLDRRSPDLSISPDPTSYRRIPA